MSTLKSNNEDMTINADGASSEVKFQANGVEKGSLDSSGNLTVTGIVNGLQINTTATGNLGLGTGAVDSITTGDYNTGVGDVALTACTEGIRNTAVGYQSLQTSTGDFNTAVGMQSLQVTTGDNNIALGYGAGDNITTGSSNIIIGTQVDAPSATGSNQLNIGGQIQGYNMDGINSSARLKFASDSDGQGMYTYSGRVTVNTTAVPIISINSYLWETRSLEATVSLIDSSSPWGSKLIKIYLAWEQGSGAMSINYTDEIKANSLGGSSTISTTITGTGENGRLTINLLNSQGSSTAYVHVLTPATTVSIGNVTV